MKKKERGIVFLYSTVLVGDIYLTTNKNQFYKNIRKNNLPHHFKYENTHLSKIHDLVIVSSKIDDSYMQFLITKNSFIASGWDDHKELYSEVILPAFKLRDNNTLSEILNLN